MIERFHHVPNGDGWELTLKQVYDPERLRTDIRPLAIVPGYGMNAFIFGYHPNGPSMEAYWAEKGFEVWSLNLRSQGGSRRVGGRRRYGFREAGGTDLQCALDHVLRNTRTEADRVDGIGCSLGGTYLYVYLALTGRQSVLGSVVAMGAPLRWIEVHPALRVIASFPGVLGRVPFRGTRTLARVAMPALKRLPSLLHLYMHPEITDTSRIEEMVQTVEDPNPLLNEQIARWVCSGDLDVEGVNVTEGVAAAENPLLVVLANADGIVPEETALSAHEVMASTVKDVLRVGTEAVPLAHADLFVSDYAQQWVFEPLAAWLLARNDVPATLRSTAGSGTRPRKGARERKKAPARKTAARTGTVKRKNREGAKKRRAAG